MRCEHCVLDGKKLLRFFKHHSGAQRERGGTGVGVDFCVCLSSQFLSACRKKQHENIFSHNSGQLAKFGWILTILKISLKMALTRLLPGAIQFPHACYKKFHNSMKEELFLDTCFVLVDLYCSTETWTGRCPSPASVRRRLEECEREVQREG